MAQENVLGKVGGPYLLLLSILLLGGCTPSPPNATTTPSPPPAPIPTPSLPDIVAAMRMVPQGQGVPEAAPYDANSPLPHRLVILEASGEPHEWNDHFCFPFEWQPSSIDDTELVVVVGPEREVKLDTQAYGGGPSITRYRFERDITVHEARTGDVLSTARLTGSEPGDFPLTAPVEQIRLEGGHVDYLPVLDYLQKELCRLPNQCPSAAVPIEPLDVWGGFRAFSPDGQILASAGKYAEDTKVRLWRVADGKVLHTLEHTDSVIGIVFSSDGQILASMSKDGKVTLWRLPDGQLHETLDGSEFMAFSPDGKLLASGTEDGTIQLWRVQDGQLLHTLTLEQEQAYYFLFSPDSQTFASLQRDGKSMRMWRVADGKLLGKWEPSEGTLRDIAFSPDGRILAALAAGDVWLWQVANGELLPTLDLGPGGQLARWIEFSPDGQILALPTDDGKVRLWRAADGLPLYELEGYDIAFSSDGQLLALLSGNVQLLRLVDGQLLRTLGKDETWIEFMQDGNVYGVVSSAYKTVTVCRVDLWPKATTR